MHLHRLAAVTLAALAVAGCSKSDTKKTCAQTGCGSGQVCESVAGSDPVCADPVYVAGRVYDLAVVDPATNGLAQARVVGQDVDGAPVSTVAISATDGAYEFSVRTPRNADGSPATGTVTLRVDRAGYETFPSGLRTALPIALTAATHASGRWTVQSGLTDVGLGAIAGAPAGEIDGTVQLPSSGGALVVAECGGVAYTAVPGSDGSYAIFNVPNGTCDVTAYAKGVNYTPVVGATVDATGTGTNPVTADIHQSAVPTATVSGSVNFVSKTAWNYTSVLLVVASTFDPLTLRGQTPPGLRAGNVGNGAWSIAGIPDGHYKALAAFETDYIVRDVSPTGGTAVLEFKVVDGVPLFMDGSSAADVGMFKVTGAVLLTTPIADAAGACSTVDPLPADPRTLPIGGCTTTSTAPSFAWKDYPSASYYEVKVVSETGATAWTARVSASPVVYGTPAGTGTVTSATPPAALATGSTYQVRLVAYNVKDESISMSEDLLGVFTVVAP
jgi:hypothetical protein